MNAIKEKLALSRIEAVAVTHYHGDHIYNIPTLVGDEGAEVLALDCVAEVMEQPEHFNLAAPLWWYGAGHERIMVQRKLRDGEAMRWHEYDLRWFHLGGQTYYHAGISALVDGTRVCFAGDAVYGWKVEPEPVLCYNDAELVSRGWVYAMNKLLAEKPELLVCGHGSSIRQPMPLLQAKKEAWLEHLKHFEALNARDSLRAFFDPFFDAEPS
jgi:glyoxylase-like metal-dependent hydrolase (beta-lactamase superfamily II)